MELQDFIKLHEMKARAAKIYDENRNDVRIDVESLRKNQFKDDNINEGDIDYE